MYASCSLLFLLIMVSPKSTLFPYTTLFRSRPWTGCSVARTPSGSRAPGPTATTRRSEEHTSELQSRRDLVCRLLLEKKNGWLLTGTPPTSGVTNSRGVTGGVYKALELIHLGMLIRDY